MLLRFLAATALLCVVSQAQDASTRTPNSGCSQSLSSRSQDWSQTFDSEGDAANDMEKRAEAGDDEARTNVG